MNRVSYILIGLTFEEDQDIENEQKLVQAICILLQNKLETSLLSQGC